jgi:hypothetical protein
MCKGNKGNRPERKLEAQEKRAALDINAQGQGHGLVTPNIKPKPI